MVNGQINIERTTYKVSDFISWIKRESLDLSPHFQRRSVWKEGAKSYLIDTIYRNLPIPIIFLRDRGTNPKTFEPRREVIDGQQRLRTVISYIAPDLLKDYNPERDSFVVRKSHNSDLAGLPFLSLPYETQQAILNYSFSVHVLPYNIDDREVIQIFRRMNSTNYTLNNIELINSQYYGEFKTSAFHLSAEQIGRWIEWKTFTDNDISRMQEVEMAIELINSIIHRKILGKTKARIEEPFKAYDDVYPYKEIVEEQFRNTMDIIYNNFGPNKNDFVFFKKTLFYVFFCYIYDLTYDLTIPIEKSHFKRISTDKIGEIKYKNDRIRDRLAPKNVMESTDRRTTHPNERRILFNYLKGI